jgi:MFS family permease
MLKLFKKDRDLFYLMGSVIISQLGTWFTYMLMIVAVYNHTQDVLVTMILTAAEMIAGLIGGQFSGIYIEHRNPKNILIVANWVSALVISLVIFFPLNVWLYALAAFWIAFINAYRDPAFQKYLVASVEEENRMTANSSFQMANECVKIIGPMLAVSVLALLPDHLKRMGFLIDAVTYVLGALILIKLADQGKLNESGKQTHGGFKNKSFYQIWQEGMSPLRDSVMVNLLVTFLLILFGVAGADVMLTAHINDAGLNTYSVGYVVGALSLGILVTSMFAARWVVKWPLKIQLGLSGLVLGLCYGMIGIGHSILSMCVAAFLTGVANAVFNMSSSTFWQKYIPYNQLARFIGLVGSLASTATLIGMGINGILSEWLTAGYTIMLCGLLIAVAGTFLTINLSVKKKYKENAGISTGQSKNQDMR